MEIVKERMLEIVYFFAALWMINFALMSVDAMAQPPVVIDPRTGKYLGNMNANRYDSNSIANQYGTYGNPYGNTVNNPYSQYGNPYSGSGINNPYVGGGYNGGGTGGTGYGYNYGQ